MLLKINYNIRQVELSDPLNGIVILKLDPYQSPQLGPWLAAVHNMKVQDGGYLSVNPRTGKIHYRTYPVDAPGERNK